ncbi:hypothetical protein [Xanthomonas phage BUDD]|nr:hypothetical protein [Xanthomonas phage BUDD]
MIEHKQDIFFKGVMIFAVLVCQSDQAAYTDGMVHRDGYMAAARKFYEHSGYMTAKETRELFGSSTPVWPEWMVEVFKEVEHRVFDTNIWDTK